MKNILVLAGLTLREYLRDRVLHGLLVIFLLISVFGMILGQLSFAEQVRITLDFSLAVMQICACGLAIFLAASSIQKDIDRKTIFTILAKPVSRRQYLLGKLLGQIAVLGLALSICAVAIAGVVWFMSGSVLFKIVYPAIGMFFEVLILLSVGILFVQFLKPPVAVFCGIGFFLVGHWLNTLESLSRKETAQMSSLVHSLLVWILPDMEQWNWKSVAIYDSVISTVDVLTLAAVAGAWCLLYVLLALILFERRDLVS